MNIIEKQALKFILKHTQETHQQEMSDYVQTHWARYRAGEINLQEAKALAKQARPMLKPESVAELTEFVKTWSKRLNFK
ncbi:hypothetical protein [Neisseria dumasiana]|uniref:Antitoxin VbhA domain-containing protein n=1 Tax=Neisseria dumasiana TaxID=1931275 RepID=A0ABX3WNF6_9NEIS|nr:hypothetical protein [Neisseria dumasiana]OSI35642.1 hypothetical protein BV913_04380 [Neisseria dumasiana]UOO84940.1 hypothetical protein LVJ88_02740 [Neisseria dumasiana]